MYIYIYVYIHIMYNNPVPLKNGTLGGGGVRNSIYEFQFFFAMFWLFDATGKGKDT